MPLESADTQQIEPVVTGAGATFDLPSDPPAGGDAGADDGHQEPGDGKQSRQQRRAERGNDFAARAAAAEDRARRAEEANQETARRLAELQGRFAERDQQQQRSAGPDPDETALAAAEERMTLAVARMSTGQTTDELTAAKKDWLAAQREVARIVARQEARGEGKAIEERVTGRIPAQVDPRVAAFRAEFPWIVGNDQALAIAKGYAAQVAATERRDMNNTEVAYATHREAAAHAGRILGLGGGRQAPSDVEKQRLAGTRGGDSGAGNNGGGRVHLDSAQMKMAERLFRDLPAEQAHLKWWKEIGSKIEKK